MVTNTIFVLIICGAFVALALWSLRLALKVMELRRLKGEAEATTKQWAKELIEREKEYKEKLKNIEGITRHKAQTEFEEKLQKEIDEKTETLRRKFTKANAHLMGQALIGGQVIELKTKMNDVLEKQFSRMTQEFVGCLTDDGDAVKEELMHGIGDRIWDRLQQVKENFKDSPYVIPKDCKLAYTKGNRTVIVIEQPPQVRTVTLTPSLLTKKEMAESLGESNSGYRFSLSFPYVYFFIAFDRGKYAYHELYFRNSAITSVKEHVYLAPIPNVWRDRGKHFRAMCMGEEFGINKDTTIARQCEHTVSVFWQSTFNEHLGEGGKRDSKIKNWRTWQKNTQEDPLFILNVKWKNGRSAKGILDSMFKGRDHKHELDGMDKEIKNEIDSGIGRLTESVKEAVDAAKKHKLKKKDVDEFTRESVEQLLIGHSDAVFDRCTDV